MCARAHFSACASWGCGSGAGGGCEVCPPLCVDSSEEEGDSGEEVGGEGSAGRAGGVRGQSAPAFDRSVASGRIADGAGLYLYNIIQRCILRPAVTGFLPL